ncbi:hypothetical protein EWB00_002029 [Schistosoma japonicum]|uniref:Uncharacterized protein n=1 Tax=Schistosoma japonicum TaxID=6182 RepID=A0A4Z2CJZ6_SCHJA|nr:hypothetical protein EWB00_002029 [Schistosoma japonicum]
MAERADRSPVKPKPLLEELEGGRPAGTRVAVAVAAVSVRKGVSCGFTFLAGNGRLGSPQTLQVLLALITPGPELEFWPLWKQRKKL